MTARPMGVRVQFWATEWTPIEQCAGQKDEIQRLMYHKRHGMSSFIKGGLLKRVGEEQGQTAYFASVTLAACCA